MDMDSKAKQACAMHKSRHEGKDMSGEMDRKMKGKEKR